MKRIDVEGLPDDPLGAAGIFHQNWLEPIKRALGAGEDVMVVLPPADHTHGEWRKAAVAMLARKHTPARVNFVAGEGEHVEATGRYLAGAPGITGQYLRAAS